MPDLPDDKITLERNGKVTVLLGGITYRLRRPTVAEYRELADVLGDVAAARDEEGFDAVAAMLGWVRLVFERLADSDLPDDDGDLPAWLLDGSIAAEFVTHWRAVPLARSGR